jgi:hypothetical protein
MVFFWLLCAFLPLWFATMATKETVVPINTCTVLLHFWFESLIFTALKYPTMKNFYLSLLVLCCALTASAQFSGNYAPANWTTVLSAGSDGSVNTAAAPASITITGSDDPTNPLSATPVNTDYTIVATTSGTWRFSWAYHSNDVDLAPQYDPAGILINGVFTQLTDNGGNVDQSGTFTAPYVAAGTVIGFRISAIDNSWGNATLTISAFAAPGNVLPVTLLGFAAKSQPQNVLLQWKTADESNLSGFTVERSADGRSFGAITTLAARSFPTLRSSDLREIAVCDRPRRSAARRKPPAWAMATKASRPSTSIGGG